MTWLDVGPIDGVLVRSGGGYGPPRETLLAQGGVVGRRLPSLRATVLRTTPGDALVLATDGIHPRFAVELPSLASPRKAADRILSDHRTGTDDALVVVARYRGVRT